MNARVSCKVSEARRTLQETRSIHDFLGIDYLFILDPPKTFKQLTHHSIHILPENVICILCLLQIANPINSDQTGSSMISVLGPYCLQ